MSGSHLSKDFFDLIKSIGEAKSKQEEDKIISGETSELKKKINDRSLSGKKLKEYLLRMIYVEMLGHDASFGYMKAVELSASSNLLEKRVAYLCAGLCFAPDNEFRMMLVNRLQRDLQSSNVLEISIALTAAAKILTTDMIPAVLPIVVNLLKHDQDIVRKKCVMLLHRFLQLQPESVAHLHDKFRIALCDKDPAVMGASLHIFHELVKVDPTPFKHQVSSFVSILKQVAEHRLPREFDYHRVPAPWIQIKLLRILSYLGRGDPVASEQMYEVLLDTMRRADSGMPVGSAILYECTRCATIIYPNTNLLDVAASSIARFLSSPIHNFKYLGITGLVAIVNDHPKYAAAHQLAVLDCLEDTDETLKRKTLDLLYRMTNTQNVEIVCAKLLEHLRTSSDTFIRQDLVHKITSAAERYAPSNSWYISTCIAVFEAGGDLVREEIASNMQQLIADGGDDVVSELRSEAVEALLALTDKPALSNILLRTMFWILGEYAASSKSTTPQVILEKIVTLMVRAGLTPATRAQGLSAIAKLLAQQPTLQAPPSVHSILGKYLYSRHSELAQRCAEILALIQKPQLMKVVLPFDASNEDISVGSLSFLDGFVNNALMAGARAYSPPENLDPASSEHVDSLRFEAYEAHDPSVGAASYGDFSVASHSLFAPAGESVAPPDALGALPASTLGFGVGANKGVWSREGYKTSQGVLTEKPTVASNPPPTAASSVAPISSASQSAASSSAPWEAPVPIAPAAPVQPPVPKEVSEREKLAAALFGGISTTPSAPAAPAPVLHAQAPRATPSPFSTTPSTPAVPSLHIDPFAPAPSLPVATPNILTAAPPASITSLLDLSGTRVPQQGNTMYLSDRQYDVAGHKILNGDSLTLIVFVLNKSIAPAAAPSVTLSSPSFLRITSRHGPLGPVATESIPLGSVSINNYACVAVTMNLAAVPSSGAVKFTLSQTSPMAAPIQCDIPVPVIDILRPARIDTATFGGIWTQSALSSEKVVNVPQSAKSFGPGLLQTLGSCQMHHIQTIEQTKETIAASQVMGLPSVYALLHIRQTPVGGLELRLKSVDPTFTDAVVTSLASAFQ